MGFFSWSHVMWRHELICILDYLCAIHTCSRSVFSLDWGIDKLMVGSSSPSINQFHKLRQKCAPLSEAEPDHTNEFQRRRRVDSWVWMRAKENGCNGWM